MNATALTILNLEPFVVDMGNKKVASSIAYALHRAAASLPFEGV